MDGAFYIGAAGLRAEQRGLEALAHNIANLNTPAFKRSAVKFTELLSASASGEAATMSGVALGSPAVDLSAGEVRPTGQDMDLAIDGDGFLEVTGDGEQRLLWRGGRLSVTPEGLLAAGGRPLQAMITVPADAIGVTISTDGKVSARFDGDAPVQQIGELEIVRVTDPGAVKVRGDGLFEVADGAAALTAAPGQDGAGRIVQGSLEQSNVNLADEMVSLMLLQRAFAANAQIVQAGDQLMAIANGLRR